MGPDKPAALNHIGIWKKTYKSYVGDAEEEQREEEEEEQHYQSLNDKEYEHIYENLPSAFEVQTLIVEVNGKEVLRWRCGGRTKRRGRRGAALPESEWWRIRTYLRESTLSVWGTNAECGGKLKEVVPGEVHNENGFYESVYPESKLDERRRKQGFYELPPYREMSEEEEDDYDDNKDSDGDKEGC